VAVRAVHDVAAPAGGQTRLRALRRRRETTLADLSAATGISLSTLSRLESGARRPTLELLLPLARAHGVTLDELVGAPPTGDPRVHLRPVTRHGMTMLPLTRRPGGIQAYKLVIPASSRRRESEPQAHEGYEWLYVLNGRLRLVLGEHDLVLAPGEAAEFDTRAPHWSAPPMPSQSSSSASSAGRVNARTSAPAPGETEQPAWCQQRASRHRWRIERALSWLSCVRRLQVRWDRDSGRWFGFLLVACAVVCFNRL
jgi:transcriptional regulator with XRE-family HTH domain